MLIKKKRQKMEKNWNPTFAKWGSTAELFVLCSRNDPMEVHGIMTSNPSDFRTVVGGKGNGIPLQPLWYASTEAHIGVSAPFQWRWMGLFHPCQCWNWWKMWWKTHAPIPCPTVTGMATPSSSAGTWEWAGLAETRGCCLQAFCWVWLHGFGACSACL